MRYRPGHLRTHIEMALAFGPRLGMTVSDLLAVVGTSQNNLHNVLGRMVRGGLIVKLTLPNHVRFFLTQEALEAARPEVVAWHVEYWSERSVVAAENKRQREQAARRANGPRQRIVKPKAAPPPPPPIPARPAPRAARRGPEAD